MDGYEEPLKSGNASQALQALRELLVDYLIHETGNENRCPKCQALQTRTSDIASIALRLEKLISETGANEGGGPEDELARLRHRNAGGSPTQLPASPDLGTRSAPRRSGGHRPSRYGGDES